MTDLTSEILQADNDDLRRKLVAAEQRAIGLQQFQNLGQPEVPINIPQQRSLLAQLRRPRRKPGRLPHPNKVKLRKIEERYSAQIITTLSALREIVEQRVLP